MEHLFENDVLPYLRNKYNLLGTIKASVLHAAGIGESQIDEWIGDLEMNANPTELLCTFPSCAIFDRCLSRLVVARRACGGQGRADDMRRFLQ